MERLVDTKSTQNLKLKISSKNTGNPLSNIWRLGDQTSRRHATESKFEPQEMKTIMRASLPSSEPHTSENQSGRLAILFIFFMALGLGAFAQCPTPANDGVTFFTGSGDNPATTLGPAVNIGTTYPGYTTRMLLYMNTVNQFDIPDELTSLPTANSVYQGNGQQLMVNFAQASSATLASTNLEPGTTYHYAMVKYVDCGDGTFTINNNLVAAQMKSGGTSASGLSENVTAKDVVFGTVGASNIPLNAFTGITEPSTPAGYVIKISPTNSFTPIAASTNPATLTANTIYQGGDEQIVYVGSSTSPNINVTGLHLDLDYYFKVYGYTAANYYQQAGHTAMASTASTQPAASISLTGNTNNNMIATVDDGDIVLSATTNSGNSVIYQLVDAPYYTSLSGSTLTLGKSGTITLEAIAPGDATYQSNKETITITVNKATPTNTFDAFTVGTNTTTTIPFTTNSDGERTYSIVGASNGNSLTGAYNHQVASGPSSGETLLEVSTPETDYYLAATSQAYVTSVNEGLFFGTASNLYSLTGGSGTSLVDYTVDATATGTTGYTIQLINGKLWVATENGGTHGKGVLYTVDTDGSNFNKITDFNSSGTSTYPASIQEINGKVYGVNNSGASGFGEIWSANTDGTGYSVIHSFGADLYLPWTQLIEYNSKIYGTANVHITTGRGGIFSMDYDGTGYTVEYLCSTTDQSPFGGLTMYNGLMWFPTLNDFTKVFGWNPTSKTVTHTVTVNGSTSYFEPVVAGNEMFFINPNQIEKVTFPVTTASLIHTFNASDDIDFANSRVSYDGTRLWGTAKDGTNTFPVVYSILPDGTDLKQEFKGTTAEQVGYNVVSFVDTQTPSISFANQTVEHQSVTTLMVSTSSTGNISYELIGDVTGSSLSGDQFTAGNTGTVTIRATAAANNEFNSVSAEATFTITPNDPTATFSDISSDFAGPTVALAPNQTNYSGGTITYSFVDGGSTSTTGPNTGSAISGNQLTVGTPGTETIRATFPANSNFNSATFDFQLTINNATADLSGFVDFAVQIGQDDEVLTVSSASGIAMSYSLLTSNTGTLLKGANNAVLQAGTSTGTETLRVTVIEPNYNSTTKDVTVTVERGLANITWNPPSSIPFNQVLDNSILNATADVPGAFTYFYQHPFDGQTSITPDVTRFFSLGNWVVTAQFTPADLVNYQHNTYTTTITTAPIDLVIKLDDLSKNTGSADPAFTYTIVSGQLELGHQLFVPMTRESGTAIGTYAITIDNTQQSTQNDGEGSTLICPNGLCVWGDGQSSIYETMFGDYNITIENGTFTITDKTPITSGDLTFNAPASLTYDAMSKAYTVTPDAGLSPALPAADIDLTYEGVGGTTYASSSTAPTDGGTYLVTATVKATNGNYAGQLSESFEITPAATSITLDIPGAPLPYSGSPQGISPTANDVDSNPLVPLTTEYSIAGTNAYSTTAPTNTGTYNVRVNVASSASNNYVASTAAGTFSIEASVQVITFNAMPEVACGQIQIDLTQYASSDLGNTLTFASSDLAVASISGGVATIVGAGTTTITASQPGDVNTAAALDVAQDLTVAVTQENFTVDNPADIEICDAGSYTLPALTSGDYYTGSGGTGMLLNAGETISSTTTLYVYGVSSVNATCTDENSFIITFTPVSVDLLSDVTETGFYTLPVLTNGNYFTATGGGGTPLNAGDQISSTQTVFIYAENSPTCSNESSFVVTIIPNPALHFDQGTNYTVYTEYDYLSVPDANSLDFTTAFTFEAWVNFDQLTVGNAGFGWNSLFQKSYLTDAYGLMVYGPNKTMRFYHTGVGTGFTDYIWTGLAAGTWHHVAVKWDGTAQKASILIDGVEVASNTSLTGTLATNAENLIIGANDNRASNPYPFDGAMDEIRFWNVARTDAQINASKDFKLQGTEPGLVLYYDFNEGTIDGDNTGLTQVTDRSAAGNHASFNRFALSGTASNYVDGSGNGVNEGQPQTITFNALSNVTFGDANFDLTATASSGLAVAYSSSNTAVATVSGSTVTIIGTGTTTISASQGGNLVYSAAPNVNQTLMVDPFGTTISLNLPGTNPTYSGVGQGISPTANDASSNPTLAVVTEYSPTGANTYSSTLPIDAGTYDVRVNLNASETNYTATEFTGTFTIDKAPLTARLNDATIVYGLLGANDHPATYTGFVNGETETVLSITTGSPTVIFLDLINGGNYDVGGPYVGGITWENNPELRITASNYNITFEPGDITAVTARPINVTANARSITYGEDANTGHTVIFEPYNEVGQRGLAVSDNAASFAGSAMFDNITEVNAGVYADVIAPNGGLTNSNYAITFVPGELTITEKALTITADNRTITYGDDANTGSSVTYFGFITGENESHLGGILTFQNISQFNTGTFAGVILPEGLTSANYNITFTAGDLTINPKDLTVSANNRTITYGEDANIGNTVTYTGFVPGETATEDLGGTLTFANITQTDAGAYTGVIIPSGLTSSNYSLNYVQGDLTIDPRAITITADAKSKVFGEVDPALTYQVTSGAIQGSDVLAGELTRASGEDAGTYAIGQGTLVNTNYTISFTSADLTIAKADQTIVFIAIPNKVFGDADIALATTGGGSGNPVTLSSDNTNVATLSGSTVTIVGVGSATITANQAGDANHNDAAPVNQVLTVSHGAYERFFVKVHSIYGLNNTGQAALVKTLTTTEGQNIEALVKVGSQIWGTTSQGGANSMGTMFRMDPDGSNFEKLHDFAVAEGSPRNDLAVVADTAVYGVAGNYGIFRASVANPSADLSFYNGYSGGHQFNIGLHYHKGKLWTSDNDMNIVAVDIDFSGHIAENPNLGGAALVNVAQDFISEGFRMLQSEYFTVIGGFFNYETPTYEPVQDWDWQSTTGNVPIRYPLDTEFLNQTKTIFADGLFFTPLRDANAGVYGIQTTGYSVYNSRLGLLNDQRHLVPQFNTDIGTTSVSSLAKPYVNIYDVRDNVVWGIRGDAADGLFEAFSYDLNTTQYQIHDFGGGNLTAGVPNAGFFNFRRTATLVTHDQTKVYGDPVPAFTHEIWGLDAGDDASTIGGVTTSAEVIYESTNQPETLVNSTTHPGLYPIKAVADTANGKYDLRHQFGVLKITYGIQQSDIDFAPTTASLEYDGTSRAFTASGKSGTPAGASGLFGDNSDRPLVSGDFDYTFLASADGGSTYTIDLGTTEPVAVGHYRMTATVKSSNLIYTGSATHEFEITPTAITVTADAQTKVYGESDPALSYQVTTGSLLGSDVLTGGLVRASGEDVGAYVISQGTLGNSNYAITFVTGDMTITEKALTVTADNRSITFGDDANSGNSVSYSGFITGENESALAGTLTFANITQTDAGSYSGVIIPSGLTSSNYAINFVNGNLTIGAKTLTVTADNRSITYGEEANSSNTVSYTGFISGENESALGGILTFANITETTVGSYPDVIVPSGLTSSNYAISFVSGELTIGTRVLTVTADNRSITYGEDANSGNTVSYTGFITGENESVLGGTLAFANLTHTDAGSYSGVIVPSGLTSSNYAISFVNGDLTIGVRALTVTADNRSITYGDYANSGNSVSYSGFITGENESTLGGTLTFANITQTDAGSHPEVIIPSGLTSSNYAISYVNGDLTIGTKALTVTADNRSITYGDDANLSNSVSYSGFIPGENESVLGGTLAFANIIETSVGVHPEVIIPSGLTSSNYNISFVNGDLTIGTKALTVTADNRTITYGNDANSGNTVTYSGFVNGDNESALSGTLTFVNITETNAGAYPSVIIPGGLTSSNYVISFMSGDLTISPRILIVTSTATKVYGETDPVFVPSTSSGDLESGDAYTGSMTRSPGEDVGTYAISQGSLTAGPNYLLTFTGGSMEITERPLTITADNRSITYGEDANAVNTVSYAGFITGENESVLGGALAFDPITATNVGSHPGVIVPNGSTSSNYAITFVGGDLTIGTKVLTITADNRTISYGGDANTGNTVSYAGFITGENESALSGTLTFDNITQTNVGSYSGVIIPGGLTSSNYAISFVSGDLTIGTRSIFVNATSAFKTYGESDPGFTPNIVSGSLVGSDAFSGTLTRDPGEDVGAYTIRQGSLSAGANYTITFLSNGKLTINEKALTITADNRSITYGDDANAGNTVSYAGFITGESESVLGGTLAFANISQTDVGSYSGVIVPSGLTSSNYAITFSGGDLTIGTKALTITADNRSITYGDDANAGNTVSYAGLITGENESVLSGTLTFASITQSDAGSYSGVIIPSGLTSSNYVISFVNGDLTIGTKVLTITGDNRSITYGDDANAGNTVSYAGFISGENESALGGTLTFSNITQTDAGSYPGVIIPGGVTSSNYAISFVDGNLTIDPLALSITADNKTKVQSSSDPVLTYTMTAGSLINGDLLSGTLSRAAGETLGDYAIQQGTLTAGGNYNINFTDGTFTITDKFLQSITFNALSDVTYGDADFTLNATGGGSGNPVIFTGDNNVVATVAANGDVTIVGVGTVNITANQAGDATYAAADPVVQTLTVNKKSLIVTADNQSKTYGAANPTLTISYTGFSGSDDASVLNTLPVATTTADVTSVVGDYTITASGGLDDNYTFSYADGTLTVKKATLIAQLDDASFIYGTTTVENHPVTYSGFVNADTEAVLTISADGIIANVNEGGTLYTNGHYPVSITPYSGGVQWFNTGNTITADNYDISYTAGDLTVTKAALTITGNDRSIIYGSDANTGNTTTYGTFVSGEDETFLTGTLNFNNITDVNVGNYNGVIIPSGLTSDNYDITYVNGDLTINQATLTVTADNQSKTYGASNPTLSITYSGFQNSDDETSLTTVPTATTSATSTSSVDTYAITASGGADDNYAFSYTDGTLTVNQATLTVTAGDQTITYGDQIPAFTPTYTGFIAGDDESVLDTAPTASTIATTTSDAGAYSIAVSGGTDNNYAFAYTDGTLTINKADQTITFDALTDKNVGDADFDLTATATSGLTVTYTSSDETVATVSGSTVTILAAGTTTIAANQSGNTNFNVAQEVTQTLTVITNIQDQAITFETLVNQTYGASPFELAGTASSGLTVTYTSSETAVATVSGNTVTIHGVGTTIITASQAGNESYAEARAVEQALTVDPATLTATADDQTKIYGEANPTLTLTYVGFVNGEDASLLSTQPTVSTLADAGSEVGTYEISLAGGSSSNYEILPVQGTMTITKATLVATADDQVMRTGQEVPTLTISFNGFVNGDTEAELDIFPAISTDATSASPSGLYDIVLAGGEDNNYELTLINGTLTVETVLGLVLEQSQIMIYPNPVVDRLHIDFPQSLSGEVINVQLFDLEGRKLRSQEVQGYGIALDVRDLPSGILILQMSADGEVIRRRIKKD